MNKEKTISRIRAENPNAALGVVTMFVDLFCEYHEATRNIDENGVIVQHPRTGNPIQNPYLARRDKARAALLKLGKIKADWIWRQNFDGFSSLIG